MIDRHNLPTHSLIRPITCNPQGMDTKAARHMIARAWLVEEFGHEQVQNWINLTKTMPSGQKI